MFWIRFIILLFLHIVNSCNKQVGTTVIRKVLSAKRSGANKVNNAISSTSQAIDKYDQKHCESLDHYNWCKHSLKKT